MDRGIRCSPRTRSDAECSPVPKLFVTLHVYLAVSSGSRLVNFRLESPSSVLILILSSDLRSRPSFNQRKVRGGSPCDVRHATIAFSPDFRFALNSNGVILGTTTTFRRSAHVHFVLTYVLMSSRRRLKQSERARDRHKNPSHSLQH